MSSAEVLTIDVEGTSTACVSIAGSNTQNGALVLLTDIHGIHQSDTQSVAQQLAERTSTQVYIPDYFRGKPWSKDDEAGTFWNADKHAQTFI
jgi:hypothetical protein